MPCSHPAHRTRRGRWLPLLTAAILGCGGLAADDEALEPVSPYAGTPTGLGPAPRAKTLPARDAPAPGKPAPAGGVTGLGFTDGRFDGRTQLELAMLYSNAYMPTRNLPMGWTGDANTGDAGDVAPAYRQATLDTVNFYRALVGLPAVGLNATKSAKCQEAALMMSANDRLDHYPQADWTWYTADGAEAAAHANLALGRAGPEAVDGYMDDTGDGNHAVGHRRWILSSRLGEIGAGSVDHTDVSRRTADALWVIGDAVAAPDDPDWTSWPSHGAFPHDLLPSSGRWSLSVPGATFLSAAVTMSGPGGAVTTTIISNNATGMGDNTLVFVPEAGDLPASAPATPQDYTVTVTGVAGVARSTYSWTVTIVDPLQLPAGFDRGVISGPATAPVGVATSWEVAADAAATGLGHRALPVTTEGTIPDAAESLDHWDWDTWGYVPLTEDGGGRAGKAYHQVMTRPQDQFLTGNRRFLLCPGATLAFYEWLGWATDTQVAVVQLSENDRTWATLYERAGSGGSGDTGWTRRTIDLADRVGQVVRFRLLYRYIGGQYYPQTSDIVGWRVDDFDLTHVRRVEGDGIAATTAATDAVGMTLPTAGRWALQARALVGGDPVPWWSEALLVTAAVVPLRDITIDAQDGGGRVPGIPFIVGGGPEGVPVAAGWAFAPLDGSAATTLQYDSAPAAND